MPRLRNNTDWNATHRIATASHVHRLNGIFNPNRVFKAHIIARGNRAINAISAPTKMKTPVIDTLVEVFIGNRV